MSSKDIRILELYDKFMAGKIVHKKEEARRCEVSERSIQRDIDCIRAFLAQRWNRSGESGEIIYDSAVNGYRMVAQEESHLSKGELLAVCKILIESRAFKKCQLTSLLKRILGGLCASAEDYQEIRRRIDNEVDRYREPAHGLLDPELLWDAAQAIQNQKMLEIAYTKLRDKEVCRRIEPVGLLFSEYYFYLIGVIDNPEFHQNSDSPLPSPAIYRLDRIRSLRVTEENFTINYRERFQEGEYRNRVQFMYGGKVEHIRFKYYGVSVEAVLDRLPMAEIVQESEGVCTVKAEVLGPGILMWLLSQGSKVEVLSPEKLKEDWLREVRAILEREENSKNSCGIAALKNQ